jgi:hypothetical protein
MSTAVEPADVDPPYKKAEADGDEEEEDPDKGPHPFNFYIQRDKMPQILDNRWGLFFLTSIIPYAYHFVSIIIGMDKFVHWSRFTGCVGATNFTEATEVFDTALVLVLVFHIVEWVRWTLLITTILVGVPWLVLFNVLSINFLYGIIALIVGMATGFGAE